MRQKKAFQDMFLMLFFAVVALILIWVVIPNQIKVTAIMEKEVLSPRTVPYLAAGGILLISVIGFLSNLFIWLRERKTDQSVKQESKPKDERINALFSYLIFLLIVLYGVLFQYFGIVVASLVVPPVMLYLLRCRKWYMYLILYAFFGIMYTLFTVVLHVPIK